MFFDYEAYIADFLTGDDAGLIERIAVKRASEPVTVRAG